MKIIEHSFSVKGKLSKRKKTTEIILHCSATPEGKNYTVYQIDTWHKRRKFSCIGYHFVIYRDGSIHMGRPEDTQGAHCLNHNSNSVGICYIGGCANKKGLPAKDTRTLELKNSLIELVTYLLDKYNLSLDDVHCHNEFSNKACPSFLIESFRNEFKKD